MAPPHHHLLTSLSHLQHLCSSPVLSISYKIAKNKELLFPEDIFKALYGSACHTDDWLYHERIYFKRSVNMRLKSYVLNMIKFNMLLPSVKWRYFCKINFISSAYYPDREDSCIRNGLYKSIFTAASNSQMKVSTYKIFWATSNKLLSFWNFENPW